MNDISSSRKEALKTALEARIQEVEYYQTNIDNYVLALEEIATFSEEERLELAEFVTQLTNLLASERLEQKKAKVMLAVVKKQVG
jgi:hypothetical protein